MNPNSLRKPYRNVLLLLILVVAAILRFYHLSYQSFGLDELHTMNEADPGIRWKEMFKYLGKLDQHPPLFFVIERILFTLFGSSEWVARSFTALCGLLGVWAMYLLGKELLNKRLGLLAAAFTCINYFCIFYSQETRGYSLAFLLSALSYMYFIRLVRRLEKKDMWLYTLFTLGVMYTHYFGIFVALSQFMIAFALYFGETNRRLFIRRFLISGVVIAAVFGMWLPFVKATSNIKSFWIQPLSQEFIFEFFHEYFGNAWLLMPILIAVFLFYLVRVFSHGEQKWTNTKNDPLLLGFVLFSVSVVVIYMIPYIRSVLVVPMLISRYTIVALPLFLLAFAYGVELIPNRTVAGIVAASFIFLSFVDILVAKNFYSTSRNTRFRELSHAMVDTADTRYPILSWRTGWHQGYYLRKFGYKGQIIRATLPKAIDSIFERNALRDTVRGFWVVDAFFEPGQPIVPDAARQAAIDKAYVMVREVKNYDAEAKLYVVPTIKLDTADFSPKSRFTLDNQRVIAVWGDKITSNPFRLSKGSYLVWVNAIGQAGGKALPHLITSLNDQRIGADSVAGAFQPSVFRYTAPSDTDTARIGFQLDNDYWDPVTHEDRNVFVKEIVFIKQ